MNRVYIGLAESTDLISWMDFIQEVRWNFPGLDTSEQLEAYRQTVIKNMNRHTAIYAKDGDKIIGIILFSVNQNVLGCMAVDPSYRRNGIASQMIELMLHYMDRSRDIIVTTFREGDENSIAPRALYKKLGFIEGEFCEEFNYPHQKFILQKIL
jgi:ribosomal protein S18 acetylase RimI-like enzyme